MAANALHDRPYRFNVSSLFFLGSPVGYMVGTAWSSAIQSRKGS